MALAAQPLLLDLGLAVKSAGFMVADHERVIAELADFPVPGLPTRAVPKRRAEFLAGRWAARQALSALGVDAIPGRNEDGSPHWPSAVVGSITHGAARALCAVARVNEVRGLGIDAERLMKASTSAELRARICSEEERVVLQHYIERPEHDLVTLAFSAKESLYKCLYPMIGRFMDFQAASVVEASVVGTCSQLVGTLTLELQVEWSAEFPAGRKLQAAFAVSEQHVETAVVLVA